MEEPIGWTNELLTENRIIDTQHRLLFTILDRMEHEVEVTHIDAILRELTHYTETHFRDEELFMAQTEYPDIGEHQKLHFKLIEEVKAMSLLAEHHKISSWVKIRRFLKNWLREHILGEDLKFIRYTKEHR